MEFICPKPPALGTITTFGCPEKIGQIQKIIFQRSGFEFTGGDFVTEGTWTPLIVAADDTKIVITPYLESVVVTPTEALTEGGGDNSTLNGRELVVGEGNAVLTAMMRNIPGRVVKSIKDLAGEAENDGLVAWFLNQWNQLVGVSTDDGQTVTGIPLHAFFMGDAGNEGFATDDKATLRFGLDYGWRDNLWIKKPDFNAKAVLVTAET